ncbi:hypothetical protein MRX96_014665 [Rhipicephalus microplus]
MPHHSDSTTATPLDENTTEKPQPLVMLSPCSPALEGMQISSSPVADALQVKEPNKFTTAIDVLALRPTGTATGDHPDVWMATTCCLRSRNPLRPTRVNTWKTCASIPLLSLRQDHKYRTTYTCLYIRVTHAGNTPLFQQRRTLRLARIVVLHRSEVNALLPGCGDPSDY